jgi:hypothetical protein
MSTGGKVSRKSSSRSPTSEAKAMFNRFATINAWFPDNQVTIIALINRENLNTFKALDQMHNSLFGKEAKQP